MCLPGGRLGRPYWADDLSFDIARHVRAVKLAPPGGEDQLMRTVEDLRGLAAVGGQCFVVGEHLRRQPDFAAATRMLLGEGA